MAIINVTLKYQKSPEPVTVSMGPGDVVAAKFTTGAVVENGGTGGHVSAAQHMGSESADRIMALNTSPGDFTPNTAGKHGYPNNVTQGPTPYLYFNGNPQKGYPLAPNTTYYANLENVEPMASGTVIISLTA